MHKKPELKRHMINGEEHFCACHSMTRPRPGVLTIEGGYMELNLASTCDVLVLGSGIAGISAALTAAESGASVILVCKGRLFSGSSFYPGTWGLGLVGPADEADEADLISTIEDVGCGMADDAW